MFSGRGLCVGLITHSEVLSSVVCLIGCDREASIKRPARGFRAIKKMLSSLTLQSQSAYSQMQVQQCKKWNTQVNWLWL